ncbi:MAG: cytochrome b561 domain-containing protein [Pseudomonadota bacterium]
MLDALLAWALAPIDPGRPHDVGFETAWHGRLMVLAWGVLLPAGIIAARFFKVMPRQDWPNQIDNRIWWRTHLTTQYLGGLVVLGAVYLVWNSTTGSAEALWHRVFGWSVVAMAAVQFISGWLRGTKGGPTEPAPDGSLHGDHYDMTPRRRAFESIHKSCGYIAIAIAVASILTGLWIVNAPTWMFATLTLWWITLIAAYTALHRARFGTVSTYQAIWGPDPHHPGNRDAAHGAQPNQSEIRGEPGRR